MGEPKEPHHTCGSIDQAISRIDDAISTLNEMRGRSGYLEDLRSDNEALREWGTYWKERCEEAEEKVSSLESKVEELEEMVSERAA